MKKISLTLVMLSALFFLSCSEVEDEVYNASQDLKYELVDNSNFTTYKGVFTTLNSKFRGVVEIQITDSNSVLLSETVNKATITLQNGDIIYATSNVLLNNNEITSNLHFTSKNLSFDFSANANGNNPVVTNVIYKKNEADILLSKLTTKAPLTTFSGTYICSTCGSSTPKTFNVIISGDGTGVQNYTTQMVYNTVSYSGIGIQENCNNSGTITVCSAVSGDGISNVGFTLGSSTVEWGGEMIYSNGTPNCSELSGVWFINKGLSNEKSGTFRSDAISNCLTELVFEDFEDAVVSYTTSIPEFTDKTVSTGRDYFIRTDGTDISGAVQLSDIIGTSYFAAQDIDGEGATLPVQVTFENLDINSMDAIYFSALFAEDDDSSNQDWDGPDYAHVDYSFDNGTTWNTFFAIEGSSTGTNTPPRVDTDFDGIGDGTEITNSFQPFSAVFLNNGLTNPSASNTVSIRIELNLNSGDEDIAFDNILIRGL